MTEESEHIDIDINVPTERQISANTAVFNRFNRKPVNRQMITVTVWVFKVHFRGPNWACLALTYMHFCELRLL